MLRRDVFGLKTRQQDSILDAEFYLYKVIGLPESPFSWAPNFITTKPHGQCFPFQYGERGCRNVFLGCHSLKSGPI